MAYLISARTFCWERESQFSNRDRYHSKLYLAPCVELRLGNTQCIVDDKVYPRRHIGSIGVPEIISCDQLHVSNTDEMIREVVVDMDFAGIKEAFSYRANVQV